MSKQRPSNRRQKSPDSTATLPRPFDSAAFWRRRVFRNSYTRNGCSMRVKRWSVKIQHQGKRRTFTLATASRSEAAREARSIYQIIRAKGWEAATQTCGRPGLSLTRKPSGGNQAALSKFDACYWQERLIRRKYVDAGLTQANEFSVRMEHEGVDHYFPLGTDDEERAAGKALKIYHTIVARGWEAAFQQFSREITVAIFWSTSPVACTYATLFTFLDEALPGLLPPTDEAQPKKHVFVIEPDAEVRRTLVFWLSRQPGFECTGAFKTAEAAECALDLQRPDLLLVNRALPEMPVVEFLDRLKGRAPRLPAFMYGIYQDSDHIFIT